MKINEKKKKDDVRRPVIIVFPETSIRECASLNWMLSQQKMVPF